MTKILTTVKSKTARHIAGRQMKSTVVRYIGAAYLAVVSTAYSLGIPLKSSFYG